RTRLRQLQRVDIHFLIIGGCLRNSGNSRRAGFDSLFRLCTSDQQPRIALRGLLNCGGATGREQTILGLQELLDTTTQQRPVFLLDRKVPSEIQHSDLTYLAADALASHQPMREVSLVGGGVVGLGSTNKHPPILQEKQEGKPEKEKYYGTTKRFLKCHH
ncbi:MAG: hypothetical protein WAO71_08995, partial [Gallionella sp.]